MRASLTYNSRFFGHFHIYGGGLDVNTKPARSWGYPDSYTLNVQRDLPNRSLVCVEGWSHVNGRFDLMGRACGEIKA